jgi:hypothetical protein
MLGYGMNSAVYFGATFLLIKRQCNLIWKFKNAFGGLQLLMWELLAAVLWHAG